MNNNSDKPSDRAKARREDKKAKPRAQKLSSENQEKWKDRGQAATSRTSFSSDRGRPAKVDKPASVHIYLSPSLMELAEELSDEQGMPLTTYFFELMKYALLAHGKKLGKKEKYVSEFKSTKRRQVATWKPESAQQAEPVDEPRQWQPREYEGRQAGSSEIEDRPRGRGSYSTSASGEGRPRGRGNYSTSASGEGRPRGRGNYSTSGSGEGNRQFARKPANDKSRWDKPAGAGKLFAGKRAGKPSGTKPGTSSRGSFSGSGKFSSNSRSRGKTGSKFSGNNRSR